MSANNLLDDVVDAVTSTWDQVGFSLTSPLTIGVTLVIAISPFFFMLGLALTQKEKPIPPPPGCRRLGIEGTSNLSDQFSKEYSKGADSKEWKVKALFVYPVKSCKGIELGKSEIIRTGLKYDRQFTLGQHVTSLPSLDGKVKSEWQFITQRTFPRLANVETQIWIPDPEALGYDPEGEWVKSEGCLVIRFPFTPDIDRTLEGVIALGQILAAKMAGKPEPMVEFRVPFSPPKDRIKKMKYKHEKVTVWKDSPVALNMTLEVPEERLEQLRYTLGIANPLALFRIDTTKYREVYKCAPKKKDVGFQTVIGMQDSYPMHILNLASVHDVSSKLPKGYKDLSALRYRPNVFITGPPAFDEDDWKRARIGNNLYHISCHTTRCKLPNVDPNTGIADRNEPGTTMRKYRVIDEGSASACLGMQVTPLADGEIKVGDDIEVMQRGEHFYLKT